MNLKDLIDTGKITIEDHLIRIPLLVIDYINSIRKRGKLALHFLKELTKYLQTIPEYKNCKIIPLYNGGLNNNLEYELVLVPKDINDIEVWFNEHIQPRL